MTPPLVYVADDEPELRELYLETLQLAGYEVMAFPEGSSLIEAVARRPPALILLDIDMPGMSGWQVQARLHADAASSSIPVLAVTAQGGLSVESSAIRTLRFAGYLRKPFRLSELIEQVGRHTPGGGSPAGA